MKIDSDKNLQKDACPPSLHTCVLKDDDDAETQPKRRIPESWRISVPIFIEPSLLCPHQSGRQGNQTFLENRATSFSACLGASLSRITMQAIRFIGSPLAASGRIGRNDTLVLCNNLGTPR